MSRKLFQENLIESSYIEKKILKMILNLLLQMNIVTRKFPRIPYFFNYISARSLRLRQKNFLMKFHEIKQLKMKSTSTAKSCSQLVLEETFDLIAKKLRPFFIFVVSFDIRSALSEPSFQVGIIIQRSSDLLEGNEMRFIGRDSVRTAIWDYLTTIDDTEARIERSATVKLLPQNQRRPSRNVSMKPKASFSCFRFSSLILVSPKNNAGNFHRKRERKKRVENHGKTFLGEIDRNMDVKTIGIVQQSQQNNSSREMAPRRIVSPQISNPGTTFHV